MGKLIGWDSSDLNGVNKDLIAILEQAAAASEYDVKLTDGMRQGGLGNHKNGFAIDVKLVDPNTGRELPNKMFTKNKAGVPTGVIPGAKEAYPAYESFAQAARAVQTSQFPAYDKVFRWGGGFYQGGTAMDMMHFDITPKAKGAMALYSWSSGFRPPANDTLGISRLLGGAPTSFGPKALDPTIAKQIAAGALGRLPPGGMASDAPVPMPGRPAALSVPEAAPIPMPSRPAALGGPPASSAVTSAPPLMPANNLTPFLAKDGSVVPGNQDMNSGLPGTAFYNDRTFHGLDAMMPMDDPSHSFTVGSHYPWGPGPGVGALEDPRTLPLMHPAAPVVAPTQAETRAEQAHPRPAQPTVAYVQPAKAPATTAAETRAEQAQARNAKPDLVEQLAARAAIKTQGLSPDERDALAAKDTGVIKTTMSPAGTVQLPPGVVPKSVQNPLNTPAPTKRSVGFKVVPAANSSGSPDERDELHKAAAKLTTVQPVKVPAVKAPVSTTAPVIAPPKAADTNGLGNILGNVLSFAQSKAADLGTAATKVAQKVATSAPEVAEKAKNAAINNLMSTVAGRTAVIDPMIANFMNPQGSTYKPATQAPSVDNANSKVAKAAASGQTMVDHTGKVVTAQVVQRYNPDTNTFENHVIAR